MSDVEWKYVNAQRWFAYLEHSIDHGTPWAVFEPNGETLSSTEKYYAAITAGVK